MNILHLHCFVEVDCRVNIFHESDKSKKWEQNILVGVIETGKNIRR